MTLQVRRSGAVSGSSRYCYTVYGRKLLSNIRLPGLQVATPSSGQQAVEVRFGSFPASPCFESEAAYLHYVEETDDQSTNPHLVIRRYDAEGCYRLVYGTGVEFCIDAVRSAVWIIWEERSCIEDAVLYLLGPVLGFLLRLSGVTCLHAGAVVIGDRSLAVVGPSGAGKSTLTYLLARQGNPVVTDDVLPLRFGEGIVKVQSGYPRLRIRPDVVTKLFGHADARPRLSPNWERRYVDIEAEGMRFLSGLATLSAIYVLDRTEGTGIPGITPLGARDSLFRILPHVYRRELPAPQMHKLDFERLTALVRWVPVRRLALTNDLSNVQETTALITEDFTNLPDVRPS